MKLPAFRPPCLSSLGQPAFICPLRLISPKLRRKFFFGEGGFEVSSAVLAVCLDENMVLLHDEVCSASVITFAGIDPTLVDTVGSSTHSGYGE